MRGDMGREIQSGKNTRTVTLTVTEKCNLACTYCYEHHKSAADMTFETAKRIIDGELRERTPKENTYIEFFGGEPFMNFGLIKQVCDYVRSFYKGKLRFHACTNGTLVHGEVQEWILANKRDFSVALSADGTKAAHDINRSNSFDDIDFRFFVENFPEQPVKMTVSKETLPMLAEGVIYLTELGFEISCNLAYGIDWNDGDNVRVLEEQLDKLIDWYLAHPEAKRCRMLDYMIEVLARPSADGRHTKYCGTGTAMVCYGTDGKAYPCQFFSPLSAGDKALTTDELALGEEYDMSRLPEKCAKCYCLRICPRCFGSNYLATGDIYTSDDDLCELNKTMFRATAKLKALEWERGMLSLGEEDEQALIRSVLELQKI